MDLFAYFGLPKSLNVGLGSTECQNQKIAKETINYLLNVRFRYVGPQTRTPCSACSTTLRLKDMD